MKIPENARKVFSGAVFDVYQWPERLFDGSFATFEMLKGADSVAVIAVSESGEILYTDEEQPGRGPFLSIVAGGVENGEGPLSAAKRELLEEAGLESHDWELLEIWENHERLEWSFHLFVARGCVNAAVPDPGPGEKVSLRFADWDSFVSVVRDDPRFRIRELNAKFLRLTVDGELDVFRERVLGR